MSILTGFVTKHGYIMNKNILNEKQIKTIRKDLTVSAKVNPMFQPPSTPFVIYGETNTRFYLPRFYGYKYFGKPTNDRVSFPNCNKFPTKDVKISPRFPPRKPQKPALVALLSSLRDTGGGILSLQCGGGKTYCGLFAACSLGLKTLIIVHKEFLLDQWVERIEQFIPNAKIGRIQAKIYDVDGKDFVIGMLQSISMKDDLKKNMFSIFGTVICDEAHHISAETFSKALPKVATKYMIGLSATPTRSDGLTKVFKWFLGDIAYKGKRQSHPVSIKVIEYHPINENKYIFYDVKGNFSACKALTQISHDTSRNMGIAKECISAYLEERQNLAVSCRVVHLRNLEKCIKTYYSELSPSETHHKNPPTFGYYIGGMKKVDRDISSTKNIILATSQMVEEALDIPTLNTITLCTPMSKVEQPIGRILRKINPNLPPLVIDILDIYKNKQIKMYKTRFAARCKFYKKEKYHVIREGKIVETENKNDDGPFGRCLIDD